MKKLLLILVLLPLYSKAQIGGPGGSGPTYLGGFTITLISGGFPELTYSINNDPYLPFGYSSGEMPLDGRPTSLRVKSFDDAAGQCAITTTINFSGEGCRSYSRTVSTPCYTFRIEANLTPENLTITNPGTVCDSSDGGLKLAINAATGFSNYTWQYAYGPFGTWTTNTGQKTSSYQLKKSDYPGLDYNDIITFRYRINGCDWVQSEPVKFRPPAPRASSFSTADVDCFDGNNGSITINGIDRDPVEDEAFSYLLYNKKPTFSYGVVSGTDIPYLVKGPDKNDLDPFKTELGDENGTTFTNLPAGSYHLVIVPRIGEVASGCGIPPVEEIKIIEPDQVTVSNAGNSTEVCENEVTLSGNAPKSGERGTWSVVGGTPSGLSFNNSNEINATVTGLPSGTTTFRWTIALTANSSCSTKSDVTITNNSFSGSPSSGSGYTTCATSIDLTDQGDYSTNLTDGIIATWYDASNNSIGNPDSVSLSETSANNKFKLRFSKGNCFKESSSQITIVKHNLTEAIAGPDVALCPSVTSYTLGGNEPKSGETGKWTKVAGSSITFSNPNLEKSDVTGLTTGTYTLRWTITFPGDHGCSDSDDMIITVSSLSLSATASDALCKGEEGAISVSASGGNSPYAYSLSSSGPFQSGTTFESGVGKKKAGTYVVYLQDDVGCTVSRSVTIKEPDDTIDIGTITPTHTTCEDINSGELTISGTTGTTPFEYSITGETGTYKDENVFDELSSGSYTIWVRDGNGCTDSGTALINAYETMDIGTTTALESVNCHTGTIRSSASGGSGRYDYQLEYNDGSIAVPFSSASDKGKSFDFINQNFNRTYQVIARDHNNTSCQTTYSNEVTIYSPVTVSTFSATKVNDCFNGSFNVRGSGGSGTYNYALQRYNGSEYVTVDSQSGDVNDHTFANQDPGLYRLVVSDANNTSCKATSTRITIYSPVLAEAPIAGNDESGCHSSITVEGTGGSGTYKYYLKYGDGSDVPGVADKDNRTSSFTFENLDPGTYEYVVEDRNNRSCSITSGEVTLYSSVNFESATAVKNGGCYTGGIRATAAGGSGTYDYRLEYHNGTGWSSAVSFWAGRNQGDSYTFPEQPLGRRYRARIRDSNNTSCQSISSEIILVPNVNIVSAASTDVECFGAATGTITVTATGGSGTKRYSLSGPTNKAATTSSTFNSLKAGTYTITAYDTEGCTDTFSKLVDGPNQPLSITSTPVTHIDCYNEKTGSITVNVSGGTAPYEYTLSGPVAVNDQTTNVFNDLPVGTYTVSIKDDNDCLTSTSSIDVNQPGSPVEINSVNEVNILCKGDDSGSITVNASGGIGAIEYLLSGDEDRSKQPENIFEELYAGNYTVIATDGNGCWISQEDIILVEPETTVSINSTTIVDALCKDDSNGSITITASGGSGALKYSLSGPVSISDQAVGIFEKLPAGTYDVVVSDILNCTATAESININEPAELTINGTTVTDVRCFGGTDGQISVSVSGGTTPFSYSINGVDFQSSSVFTVSEGDYTITVRDKNECETTVDETVNQPSAELDFTSARVSSDFNGFNVSCFEGNDGEITIAAAGGTGELTYSIYKQNSGGGYTSQHNAPIDGNQGQIVIFNSNLSSGIYLIVVEDERGCSDETELTLTEPSALTATFTTTEVVCNGDNTGTLTVSASGGVGSYKYSLEGGAFQDSNTFENLTAGTYTISISDENICLSTVEVEVEEPDAIQINVASILDTQCNGSVDGSITFSASGGRAPYQYFIRPFGTVSNVNSSPEEITSEYLFSDLAAGAYILTAQDASDCVQELIRTVSEPALISGSISQLQRNSCNGVSEADLSSTISGGTGPYSVEWRNSSDEIVLQETVASTTTIFNLAKDTYTLYITDANDCTNDQIGGFSQSFDVLEPEELILESTAINVSCFELANGVVTLSASGGWQESPYTFSDDGINFSVNNVFANLDIGSHDFYVRDSYSGGFCEQSITVAISQPAQFEISTIAVVDVSCFEGSNGSFDITMTGGTFPYELSLDNSSWNELSQVVGLPEGTYSVWVRDANECVVATDIEVGQPDDLVLTLENVVNTSCTVAEGSADALVVGGTLPYAYEWKDESGVIISTSASLSSLEVGIYDLQVTDGNGCITSDRLLLSSTDGPEITLLETGDVSCLDGNDGFAVIEITGGTGPYTIRWLNTIIGDRIVQDLEKGTYSVEITDNTGCRAFREIPIDYLNLISFEVAHQDLLCFEDGSGSVSVSSLGAQLDYEYLWNTGATSSSIENLEAGDYSVDITYGDGCLLNYAITLEEPDLLDFTILNQRDPFCFEESTGLITVEAFGGTAPYTYKWAHDGSTNPAISDLPEATYEVTITDANGCSRIENILLDDPDALEVEVVLTSPTCNGLSDGNLVAAGSGGTAPYTYQWVDGEGNPIGNIDLLDNITTGTYQLTTIDANFCSRTDSYELEEPAVLQMSEAEIINPLCNGDINGSIQIAVQGGTTPYTYLWSDGTTESLLNNKGDGSYSVTVTDANDCEFTEEFDLVEPNLLEMEVSISSMPLCFESSDGTVLLEIAGGTSPYSGNIVSETGESINWIDQNSPYEITGLKDGEYTINLEDQNGCKVISTGIILIHPDELTVSLIGETEPTCYGDTDGTLEVLVQGGTPPYTYDWTNGQATSIANSLEAATYGVTITDANNCEVSAEYILGEPDALQLSISEMDHPSCNGFSDGRISTSISGGTAPYTFLWNNGSSDQNLSELAEGIYELEVVDNFGCSVSQSVELIEPEPLSLSVVNLVEPSCNGFDNGSITVEATGGTLDYTFLWNDGQTGEQAENLIKGTYTVIVTDANSCDFTLSIDLQEPSVFSYSVTTDTNINCFGENEGSLTIKAKGGVAPYTGEISSSNSLNGPFSQSLTAIGNSVSLSNLFAGDYSVSLVDANGCEFSIQATTILQPDQLDIQLISSKEPSCMGESDGELWVATVGGKAPYTYLWSNGYTGERNKDLSEGNYQVTIVDANDCEVSQIFVLSEPAELTTSAVLTDPSCSYTNDGSIDLTISGGTAPYSYVWSNGQETEDLEGLISGDFTFDIFDSNGCYHQATYQLQAPDPLASVLVSNIIPTCADVADGSMEIETSGGTGIKSIIWENGQEGETITNILFGTYSATITDEQGCELVSQFSLAAPVPVEVNLVRAVTPLCTGDSNGLISVLAEGGTGPYTYTWSNGDNGSSISNLEEGMYEVTVTDDVGCGVVWNYDLVQPNALSSSVSLTQPSCKGENDAIISISASGGTPDYTYVWDHGATEATLENLNPGTYAVTVLDANGCSVQHESLVITDPVPTAFIIEDFSICSGQLFRLRAPLEALEYTWTGPADFETKGAATSISEPGSYQLSIIDLDGCPSQTSFNVTIDDELLQSDFLVVSEAFIGDTILVIDISWPIPDEVEWDLPEEATIVTSNSDYVEIIFEESGTYSLGMTCQLAGCNASYQTSITINNEASRTEDPFVFGAPQKDLIKNLIATPNPTDGQFTINLTLSETYNAKIQLVGLSGNSIVYSNQFSGNDEYEVSLDASTLVAGVYFIHAQVGSEQKTFRLLVR